MRILLTGGTGFLGSALVEALLARGDTCTVVSRSRDDPFGGRVALVRGDTTHPGEWQRAVAGVDAVVNLAGVTVVDPFTRWTRGRKALIRSSRVGTTINVGDAIRHAPTPPPAFVSSSAVGYYGDGGDRPLDEHATGGDDFLAGLCVAWERAADQVGDITRVVRLRSAPVLGPGGGLLGPMLLPFKLGVGGAWGPGDQWLPWIAREDWVRAVLFLLEGDLAGPVNLAAPGTVTVDRFVRTLGHVLHRPTVLSVPAFALRLALGEQADALLVSQRVVPRRLMEAGFTWKHNALQEALERAVA